MSSTWLPNQASADDFNDEQPRMTGDQYAHAKINQLKSYGWQVQSTETADGKVTFTATKSDPKTGESTKATYNYNDRSYTSSVEHSFKDGSKTSEQSKGVDEDLNKGGKVIDAARTRNVSSVTTDPSGNKTTKVYDNNGSKVVLTTKFDSRFNQQVTTNFATGTKTTTTGFETGTAPGSSTTIGPNGKTQSMVTKANDGTVTSWSFDANGNANGRTIKKPDGTTTTAQSAPGGQFVSVTTDSQGKVISQNFCDKIANCANPTTNQNQQNVAGANQLKAGANTLKANTKPQGLTGANQNVAGQAALPPADNPKGQPPVQPQTKNPDGSTTTVTKSPDGASTRTELGPDGKTLGIQTFDNKGKQTSATAFGQDGKKTMTRTFGADGGSISVKFDSAGRPTSADTVDANGKLTSVTCHVPAVCAGALNQQQKQLSGAKALNAGNTPPALAGAKRNVRADILKQIGAKPNEETTTGKNKANNDALDRFKNRAKLQNFTTGNQQTKEGFAKSQIPAGSNINGKAVPRTQSPSEYSQGSMHQPHNNLTTNYNAKSKSQNLNSSAGSQGAAKHNLHEKPRFN